MNEFERMKISAQKAMIHVLNMEKDDAVLVVSDRDTKSVGEAFYNAAIEHGCKSHLYLIPEKDRPLLEIPEELNELVEGKTIVINSFKGIGEETPFRLKWVKNLQATKSIRVGHAPSITKSMMIEGPMNVDYDKLTDTAYKLMKRFENAKIVRVTAPGGTDLTLDIEDRGFSTDVQITKEPYFANLPCGEIWCGPIETMGDGIIVCDGSIGDIGKVGKPLIITMKNGKIINIKSDDQELVERVEELTSIDEEARIIGELGIGLNPGAKLSGILLEDEKALRTAHVAFGNNTNMDGGQNTSGTHRDFLFYEPTIKVTYKDGSTRFLVRNGLLSFEKK